MNHDPSTPMAMPANGDVASLPLSALLGALIFAARKPVSIAELRETLANPPEGDMAAPAVPSNEEIRAALEAMAAELQTRPIGLHLVESALGYRFQTDPQTGPWVRRMLNLEKPSRLSKPALETLAIIAYRQPVTRAEIEAVRGVAVDNMVRNLQEAQLVRIVGRSDLPGRPLLYGTTQLFLEHFGLSSVDHLPGMDQLARRASKPVAAETDPVEQTEPGKPPVAEETEEP